MCGRERFVTGGEFSLGKTSGLKVRPASDGGKGRDMHALNEALSPQCTAIQGIRRERVRKVERGRKRREKERIISVLGAVFKGNEE